jgi:hypothetical protein
LPTVVVCSCTRSDQARRSWTGAVNQRACSEPRLGGNLHLSSMGTAGTRSNTTSPEASALTNPALSNDGRVLGSRTPSPFSAARTRRSSSATALEPIAATQNLLTYGSEGSNPPRRHSIRTGTTGRMLAVGLTEVPGGLAALKCGGRAFWPPPGTSIPMLNFYYRLLNNVKSNSMRSRNKVSGVDPVCVGI